MVTRTSILLLVILLAAAFPVGSVDRADMLDNSALAVGAGSMGSGGAVAADRMNVNGLFSNPASISGLSSFTLSTLYFADMAEYPYCAVAMAMPWQDYVLGLGYYTWSLTGIPETRLLNADIPDSQRIYPTGYGYGFSEKALLFSGAYTLSDVLLKRIHLGASVKFVNQNLYSKNRYGLGLNVGAVFPHLWRDELTLGAYLTNFYQSTRQWAGLSTVDCEQMRLGLGLAYKLRADIEVKYDLENFVSKLGVDYAVTDFMSLRAGLNGSKMTLGSGLLFDNISGLDFSDWSLKIDYAFEYDDTLKDLYQSANNHFFTLSLLNKVLTKKPVMDIKQNYMESRDDSVSLSGSSEGSAEVVVYRNEAQILTVSADENGIWTADLPLQRGVNAFVVRAKAPNKALSPVSSKLIVRKK